MLARPRDNYGHTDQLLIVIGGSTENNGFQGFHSDFKCCFSLLNSP